MHASYIFDRSIMERPELCSFPSKFCNKEIQNNTEVYEVTYVHHDFFRNYEKILPNRVIKHWKLLKKFFVFLEAHIRICQLPYSIIKENALIRIVFNLKVVFWVSIFSILYENVFTISLIFLQENMLCPLAAKEIVLIIFHIQNIALPENIYVIIMFGRHSRVHLSIAPFNFFLGGGRYAYSPQIP